MPGLQTAKYDVTLISKMGPGEESVEKIEGFSPSPPLQTIVSCILSDSRGFDLPIRDGPVEYYCRCTMLLFERVLVH